MAKTKYSDDMPGLARQFAKEGLIDTDIALRLGISHETFRQYKKTRPVFLAALKAGKDVADSEVEKGLYATALGYPYEEKKVVTGADGVLRTEKTTREAHPNVTACIFWLKNRRPDRWRDVTRLERVDINRALKDASLESARKRMARLDDTGYSEAGTLDIKDE